MYCRHEDGADFCQCKPEHDPVGHVRGPIRCALRRGRSARATLSCCLNQFRVVGNAIPNSRVLFTDMRPIALWSSRHA
jgi:hypothetical protein